MRTSPVVVAALLGMLAAAASTACGWGTEDEPDLGAMIEARADAVSGPGHPGLLYGRVTTVDGVAYEGRLRFGGVEEALWGHAFNGAKPDNPWVALVPADRLPTDRSTIGLLGLELERETERDFGRPFMARFGDIAHIEARGRDLRVTLKSGTEFALDRWEADDFADGVRIWDPEHGVVDLHEREVRSIRFLPNPGTGSAPAALHGTVTTAQGQFRGLVQWDRVAALATDELPVPGAAAEIGLPFGTVASIVRSGEGAVVTTLGGDAVTLPAAGAALRGHRGLYVDDLRYGRVLIGWEDFERIDLDAGGAPPAYEDFPPGSPLAGEVETRSGERLAGRLVFDLDESETTETLDAPSAGIDYSIPFGLVHTIERLGATAGALLTLHGGERLEVESAGDVGDDNAGLLVFSAEATSPRYVPWSEVSKVTFERPAASYPRAGDR